MTIIFLFTLFVLTDYFWGPDFSKKEENGLILSCKTRIPSKNTQCVSGIKTSWNGGVNRKDYLKEIPKGTILKKGWETLE